MVGNVEGYLPKSINAALQILNSENVIVYAGGTDLMVRYKNETSLLPKFDKNILYIGQIDELKKVYENNEEIVIGAGCTLASLLRNEHVPEILKKSIRGAASPAIRNMGTIGGNICNASPAGDTLPVLYSLNSRCNVISEGLERTINIENFIYGPRRTALKKNEILKSITISKENFNIVHYEKVGARKASAISKLSFAGLCNVENGRVQDLRMSFGAVGATVIRLKEAETIIIGKEINTLDKFIKEAIEIYDKNINPIDDQRSTAQYRKMVVMNLIKYFFNTEVKGKN
ncbi:xanthine dehydrogenase FAD-binding subunit XdhB [Clostridium butyricum]|uniref:Xanthine dehydrogenase FAD-binding subunit XdhB n=1 Tax=Clostridium butyricum TaxID=1492 RepID=A0A512TKI1_CLOBU|nr:FAD binding domain-containing protein [Clostridium butyricum]NOW25339.1 CO/xanthine dehydrogenase FAD-binding subunit [Clostridium butyricum]GEQ20673.1 xanthine dehydrogenase FAD-binding subunit XdhB [Clostridium butyricum]